jgi:hypothetical protein
MYKTMKLINEEGGRLQLFLEVSATSLVLPCKKKKATGSPIPPLCKHFKLLVLQS